MTSRFAQSAMLGLLSIVLLFGVGAASATPARTVDVEQRTALRVPLAGIRQHLSALQTIATRNGGNRAAGTPGYDASARYVATRMRAAGYRVRVQAFTFPFVVDRSPPLLQTADRAWPYRPDRDYGTLQYSGNGQVEAPVAAVDLLLPSPAPNASTSGCEASDFESFPSGAVALLQRGTCTFREKVERAIAAGASAVVVFNEGNPGRREIFSATLGPPQVRIPALAASLAVGEALRNGARNGPTGVTVTVTTDMLATVRRTSNVIAESRTGNPASTVVVGAHLDGVRDGAGMNDNGSGSALVLELAEQQAARRTRNMLRFAWWGAEEVGLVGSRHYVRGLTAGARNRIALYLNFDMVGSPNFVPFVYDGDGSAAPPGSAAIERVLARSFSARGLPYAETSLGGGSDHFPFAQAGIPVGGLFTGAAGQKSEAQAARFGGQAGQPYDPCYHRRCDTLSNVSQVALGRIAPAAAHAVAVFASNTSTVRRQR